MGAVIASLLARMGSGKVILGVLVGAVALALVFGYVSTRNQNTALKGAVSGLESDVKIERTVVQADRGAYEVRDAAVRTQESKEAANEEQRTTIVESNRDWADQPVPDAVLERLRKVRSSD